MVQRNIKSYEYQDEIIGESYGKKIYISYLENNITCLNISNWVKDATWMQKPTMQIPSSYSGVIITSENYGTSEAIKRLTWR